MANPRLLATAVSVFTLAVAVPMLTTQAVADPVSAADPNNVALTSRGASFVSASSFYSASTNVAIMQVNPISASPIPTFQGSSAADYRYIFSDNPGDLLQTYEIKLGAVSSLNTFSVAYDAIDRHVDGLKIETSLDGITFTQVAGAIKVSTSVPPSGSAESIYSPVAVDTLTALAPVAADYVRYDFGPSFNVANGGQPVASGFIYVLADGSAVSTGGGGSGGGTGGSGGGSTGGGGTAVPEPASAVLLGAGLLGLGLTRHRRYAP